MKKELTKKDFEYVPAYRYYSYKDPKIGVEITLEPCFSGFCVGLYLIGGLIGPIRDKECTNEQGYNSEEFIKHEVSRGIPMYRKLATWNHALKIANKFWSSLVSYLKLRKMKILKVEEGAIDPEYKEIDIESSIHGISPKGRI